MTGPDGPGAAHPERMPDVVVPRSERVDGAGVRHRATAVLRMPSAVDPAVVVRARCGRCGDVGSRHSAPALSDAHALAEAWERARADARVHEDYPDGVVWVGGAEVWLR